MGLTFSQIVAGAQQAVTTLSDPRQSSVAAAGLAGVFSAEVNNLRKQALTSLPNIGAKLGPRYQSVVDSLLNPFKSVLSGDGNIPDNPSGTILGFTYLQAIGLGFVAFLGVVFFLGRGSR